MLCNSSFLGKTFSFGSLKKNPILVLIFFIKNSLGSSSTFKWTLLGTLKWTYHPILGSILQREKNSILAPVGILKIRLSFDPILQ